MYPCPAEADESGPNTAGDRDDAEPRRHADRFAEVGAGERAVPRRRVIEDEAERHQAGELRELPLLAATSALYGAARRAADLVAGATTPNRSRPNAARC